jgi:hypothetical protein
MTAYVVHDVLPQAVSYNACTEYFVEMWLCTDHPDAVSHVILLAANIELKDCELEHQPQSRLR